MKKLTLLALALTGAGNLFAQSANSNQSTSTYIPCTGFYETIPLRDMPIQTDEDRREADENRDKLEARREALRPRDLNFKTKGGLPDPVVQSTMGTMAITAPLVKWEGGNDANSCPNDPNGAVGPTQYIQAYNSSYSVYSKTGALLKGPVDLKTLFTNIPGDDGDPVILYDKFADRWFISEFQTDKAPTGFSVAISKTNDATGAYYVYNFSNSGWNTNNIPDYLKFSIWSDGYYMTANLQPGQVVVLDRTRMLAGKSSSGMVVANYPFTPTCFSGATNNSLWNDPKILDCDASALPPYGTPNFLVFFENTNSGGASNSIVFDKLVYDTTTPQSLTITKWDSLKPAAFNAFFNNKNFATLSQPGVKSFASNAVDALDGAFYFRVPILMFTGYNSVLLANTVNTGHTIAGIRWYEVRQDPSTFHFSIFQQGTYAPGDGVNRWNGSIAMDQDGDIALAYCVTDSVKTYGGIRYTGRLFGDAAGTMTATEQTAVAGTSPVVSCGSRWGDYSDMTLDPTDGLTFWHTNEYDKAGTAANYVFSFKLASTVGFTNPIDLAQFKVYQNGENIEVMGNTLPSDDAVKVDLFDIIGKQISTSTVQPSGKAIQTQIPVNGLARGAYLVRIGNLNYQRVFKLILN